MNFCGKCGTKLTENSLFCPTCGCKIQNQFPVTETVIQKDTLSKAAFILGIIGIVGGILIAIIGHICSILSIIFGSIEYSKKKKSTGLILGIIGEIVSIVNSILGYIFVSMYF